MLIETKDAVNNGYIGQFKIVKVPRSELYDRISSTIYAECPSCHKILEFCHNFASTRCCPKCHTPILLGDIVIKPPRGKYLLYYVKFVKSDQVCYKIGYTSKSIFARFLPDLATPNNMELTVLGSWVYNSKSEVLAAEKTVVRLFKNKVMPKDHAILKDGRSEIFVTDILGLDK